MSKNKIYNNKILILIIAITVFYQNNCIASDTHQPKWLTNAELTSVFIKNNIKGTFVLYDQQKKQFISSDSTRAKQRFIPASTFKIANTLIGLSTNAVQSVDEVFTYSGEPYSFPAWQKDMSLRQAIKVSNVPVYQRLARRIGKQAMQEALVQLEYGNQNIGEEVDRFWLAGPLAISAVEQTQFLNKLANFALPFAKQHQQAVHQITLIDQGKNWQLHAKTGWTTAPTPQIGWWVGWINKGGNFYSFALNMDINDRSQLSQREKLGRLFLQLLKLLPS